MVDLGLFKLGITSDIFLKTLPFYQGNSQLAIKRFFKLHFHEPWMTPFLNRLEQERLFLKTGKISYPEPSNLQGVMGIFPPLNMNCIPGFKYRNKACLTGIGYLWDSGTILGKRMNPDTFSDLLEIYSPLKDISDIYDDAQDSRFDVMGNPGVQTNIVYSNMIPTVAKIHYNNDPKTKTASGRFYFPDGHEEGLGDGMVPTASSLGPAIKWADQFRRGVRGAKPVNFVEICSRYQQRQSIFDDDKNKEVKNNAYFGARCGCGSSYWWRKSSGQNCNHIGFLSDPYVVKFVVQSLKTKGRGRVGERFLRMSTEQLKDYLNNCKLYRQN